MKGYVALRMAYAVTIIIELLYVRYLLVRFRRIRREMNDLKRHS
jgi:hypothetical protein